ncbi:MAG: glycosyltransferase family 39 protein [Pedobacter sp.]|nr:MAG: glycosyltransferase family 39 protein [Pedobacter sp.]
MAKDDIVQISKFNPTASLFLANPLASPIKYQLMALSFLIASVQLLLRLGCLGQYGFHQDELLYLALSDHLAWGYREVPPFIAVIGKISKILFGESIAAARIIPSLCAFFIVYLTGLLTIKLGGRFFAVAIACCAVAFSPAFLAAGALFIPQVFDELCWLATAYLLVVYFETRSVRILYYLGIVIGIGILIKYTYLLYIVGLFIGIAFESSQRNLFTKKQFYIGLFIALVILSPHIWWQIRNQFPALHHYSELKKTQLTYLSRSEFFIQQLLVNATGLFVWLTAIYMLFKKKYSNYRFLGTAALLVMLVMVILNGKSYYTFGCFPALFALGAVGLERYFHKFTLTVKGLLLALITVPGLLSAIIVLPYLPIEKASEVFTWTYKNLGIDYPLKWEDQKIHHVNQNYADMIGWEELAQKTSKIFLALPEQTRQNTVVIAEKYGEAGAIDHYQKDYALPPIISLCSSYALWAPEKLTANHVIYISSLPPPSFTNAKKAGVIANPFSRVAGLKIYLIKNVNASTRTWYHLLWKTERQTAAHSFLAILRKTKDDK